MKLKPLKQFTIDHPISFFDTDIRIPFEKIAVDQNRYVARGNMDVTVTIPKQGDFEDTVPLGVRVYADE